MEPFSETVPLSEELAGQYPYLRFGIMKTNAFMIPNIHFFVKGDIGFDPFLTRYFGCDSYAVIHLI
jgi:hypothetical protein